MKKLLGNSKISQFVKGSFILIISNMFLKGINFFLLPLYTKYLTPDQLGISDNITNLTAFLYPVLVLAFDSAFSAFYFEKPDRESKEKVFNTTSLFLKINSLLAFGLLLFSKDLSILLFRTDEYSAAITIALLTVMINMWYLPYSLLIRMQNRMFLLSVINLTSSLTMILLNIYFVTVAKLGFKALILSSFFAQLLQLILYHIFSKQSFQFRKADRELWKKMLKYALPLVPVVVASWILNLSDRYIIQYYRGSFEIGLYGIATRFQSVLTLITSAIYTSYTSFAFSSSKDKNAKEGYVKVLDAVYLVLCILCFTVSIFSKDIIRLMADASYYDAYNLILPILFSQVLYAANTIVGYGFAHAKKSSYFLYPVLAGSLLNIILNLIFVPQYGVYAAVYTTLAGYGVMLMLTYLLAQKVYYCPYHIGKIMGSLLLSVIVCFFVSESSSLIVKFVAAGILSGIYVLLYKKLLAEILAKIKG